MRGHRKRRFTESFLGMWLYIYISIHARQCLKLCIYTTQALIPASALHAPPTKSIRNNRMIDSNNFQRLPGKGIPSHPATPTRKVKAITHSLWRTGTKRQATDADVLSNKRATRASCTPSPPPHRPAPALRPPGTCSLGPRATLPTPHRA